ncbi:Hypothetical predicted protein [Mytilus galloprovincialis]|uniref:Short-chain collagen C4-like n=1 Tax=Mytilus galloprovincialis TaxID=29158 RepID=A0A8B6E6T7_MYTGA|nr:Hypothetical predicted protein [Mytilus galloprovincialis]
MILWLVYVLCFRVNIVQTEDKRLLLNDPDVLVNRLNRLESVVAVLNNTVVQLKTENQQQEQTIQQLQSSLNSVQNSGATYIIWGRKQCPHNSTELVYSGYAGGGHYTEKGAAVEYVCLPPDPNYVKTSGADNGRMYGAEFYTNFYASDSAGEDVPCALCRTNHANTAIMIPGKNTCYSGWKVEYHGYLSSGYYGNDAATSYVCVDIKPEYIIGGVNQNLGKLFFEVLTKCGSLKCPPYKNNYPLTCVVCSK